MEPDEDEEGEVSEILDYRFRKNRSNQRMVEYLIVWKKTKEQQWVNEKDLSCGQLLHEYWKENKMDSRREALQLSSRQFL